MKKLFISACMLASFHVNAIENGNAISWQSNDYAVRLDSNALGLNGQCSGTIIAGKFILTAAHCLENENDADKITSVNGNVSFDWNSRVIHPNYAASSGFNSEDVAIIPLLNNMKYSNVVFISDLNSLSFSSGEQIKINGFGGNHKLNQADFTFDKSDATYRFAIYANQVNASHTVGGDSGSPWINSSGRLVGVHKGSKIIFGGGAGGADVRETFATNLRYAKDFILDNINSWHYPTLAHVSGSTTIEIQSLHRNNVDFNIASNVSGDVTIDGGTCVTNFAIAPFEICTLELSSSGNEGLVTLADGQEIKINEKPKSNGSSGAEGGSVGIYSMFAALILMFLRRKRIM